VLNAGWSVASMYKGDLLVGCPAGKEEVKKSGHPGKQKRHVSCHIMGIEKEIASKRERGVMGCQKVEVDPIRLDRVCRLRWFSANAVVNTRTRAGKP